MKQKFLALRRGLTALVLSLLLCAQALAAMPEYLVPGGSTAGIKLYTGGLLITALDEDAPAQRAGLRAGDTILKIDGACVSSAADAVRQLSGGKSVRLLVQRGQKQAEFFLTPEKTQQGYRLGVSVRDNISGIGTITFYDPETGVCGRAGARRHRSFRHAAACRHRRHSGAFRRIRRQKRRARHTGRAARGASTFRRRSALSRRTKRTAFSEH